MTALGHIGRYELIARLGAGGMGEIFLARAVGSGGFEKQVVIKRILPHLAGDPGPASGPRDGRVRSLQQHRPAAPTAQ